MSDPRSSTGTSGGPRALEFDAPNAAFRLAFGVYLGTLLAATVTTAAAMGEASALVRLGAGSSAFAVGTLVGWPLAERLSGPIGRLGRSRRSRSTFALPSIPFGAVALVAHLTPPFRPPVGDAAFAAAFGAGVAGYVLSQAAKNRYVDAVTVDDPIAAWRWEPPGSGTADLAFVVLSAALGLGNAYEENWTPAVLWTGLGLLWIVAAVLEGRWELRDSDVRPELRVHEAGLVKRRPNARTLVPWADVTGVRLTVEELVVERRLFDVHFDRDELEDPETVRDEIDRVRPRAADRTERRGATAG